MDRFAVALSCWAVGDVASYEYLAQTVRSRVGLDKVFSFATSMRQLVTMSSSTV